MITQGLKPIRRQTVALLMAVLLVLLGSHAVRAEDNISLDFRDANIRDLLKVIAQRSGTNIIAEKSVSGNVTVKLSDVYYEEAMNLIAKTNGFAVRKIGNTWIVADERKISESFDKGLTITKRLQYAKAEDVSKIITQTIKKDVKVATDDRINAVIVSGTKDMLDEVKKLIETIDTPVHQVMIESKIVEVNTNASKNIGFDWQWGVGQAGADNGKGQVLSSRELFAANPNAGSYQNWQSPQGRLFGLGDFYRGNLVFQATLSALETRSDTKILSNPKVSAMNGQQANIIVGEKIVYSGGPDQPPKEKDTGIQLKITPRINDDGYITVDVEPEVSFAKFDRPNYPTIVTRSAKTTVRVRDGEEILIGGLISETETNSNQKIPLLGNIPIVKSLFSNRGKTGESKELIILVTPHIIAQTIESAAPTALSSEASEPAPAAEPAKQPQGNAGDGLDTAFDTGF